MIDTYALPQPLTGAETVTIHQLQNGQLVKCSMPITALAAFLNTTGWVAGLPTTKPETAGVLWNNGGAVSIS